MNSGELNLVYRRVMFMQASTIIVIITKLQSYMLCSFTLLVAHFTSNCSAMYILLEFHHALFVFNSFSDFTLPFAFCSVSLLFIIYSNISVLLVISPISGSTDMLVIDHVTNKHIDQ